MSILSDLQTVWAMDPSNRESTIRLIVHPQTHEKLNQWAARAKIGEYFGLVHGRPQPHDDPEAKNRFPAAGIQSLLKPTAIFKDLRRPMHFVHGSADRDVMVYVSAPPNTFIFKHHRDFGGVLEARSAPIGSVFTTFLSIHPDHIDAAVRDMQKTQSLDGKRIQGVVLFWEWTESAPGEALPLDHETRYGTRLL